MTAKVPEKLSPAEFVVKAIEVLRADNKPDKNGKTSKGIHVVFSGFNAAIRSYYGLNTKEEVRAWTDKLVADKVITSHPCFRGAMIYLPGDEDSEPVLAKMGLA